MEKFLRMINYRVIKTGVTTKEFIRTFLRMINYRVIKTKMASAK